MVASPMDEVRMDPNVSIGWLFRISQDLHCPASILTEDIRQKHGLWLLKLNRMYISKDLPNVHNQPGMYPT